MQSDDTRKRRRGPESPSTDVAADPLADPDPVMALLDAVEALIAGTSPSAERMATVGRHMRAVLHRAEPPPCDLEIVRYAR